jgi:predicted SprT family Zn-dependent metalloprotease
MDCAIHKRKGIPMKRLQPTPEAYMELQQAYDHFNAALFDGKLPPCLITLRAQQSRSFGYFAPDRFVGIDGRIIDEIAMNSSFFGARPIQDTLATLVHEMVHAWQARLGKPPRRAYHNKEWAERMEKVGLMPSDTGQRDGKKVGEHVTHYVIDGGPFDKVCRKLLTSSFTLSWRDRFMPNGASSGAEGGAEEGEEEGVSAPKVNRSNRVKYRCPVCAAQVWGKPGLRVLCGGEACDRAEFETEE